MTGAELLRSGWDWDPSVVVGCIALLAGYGAATRFRHWQRFLAFAAGDLVMLLALVSPLDTLADQYLFSAHMLQHLFLLLVVPPLLVLGIPPELAKQWVSVPWIARCERALRKPVVAWLIGIVTLFVWHIPRLYDAAVRNEEIHIFQHICFLVSSTIFWWPVLAPRAESRLAPLRAAVYLFAGMVANMVLGIVVTFAPVGFYSAYLHPEDPLGLLAKIRNDWGLSAALDQQLGGILMWVPSGLVFLAAILGTLGMWFSRQGATATSTSQEGGTPAVRLGESDLIAR